MVAGQIKFGFFFRDGEIFQIVLRGKFVAKTQTVVKKPEAQN